jgi:predicted enzyme related to lactoylglutathione lyase
MQTARIKTMRTARIKAPSALRIALGVLACCACDSAPSSGASDGMSNQATANQPATAAGTSGSGGMTSPGSGGANAMGGAANAGNTAAMGSGGTASATAGAPATSGSGGASNGSGGMPGADGADAGADPTLPIPMPVMTPYVWGVGIGVTDMPAAVKFYTEVMKMTVEQQDVRREDRTETVLYASEAKRGSRVVLMNYDDKRNTRKITAKLVWQAPDPTAVSLAASSHPDYVSRLTGLIVQFDGPETYIQEVGNAFDSGGTAITVPYLVAMGMSVSDQPASMTFYTTAFGMDQAPTGTFPLTDATGAATVTEYTVQYSTGGGSALVIQSWAPARNSKDNPIKIVMFVPDAQAAADKVVAAGGTIWKPAERTPVYENRMLIVAKDLDGYELELVE